MAALHELIAQVQDDKLRGQLQAEFNKLRDEKTFGLVFESSAEFFPRADLPVKKNSLVAKVGDIDKTFRVTDIDGDKIFCARDKKTFEFSRQDLICVTRLGEAIYPGLTKLDEVCNAPDSSLWHMLIEAENYHALQLLKYPFAGKVDCIYIDPPYNTGARDWKYNNAFVDAADRFSHSKWLSMMERRLKLAKDLLADDGALIVAIDDNEVAHLIMLLEELFGGYDISPVIVNHHPQGGAADNISRTHEYALFVTPHGMKLIKGDKTENLEERWSLMRGGTDVRNLRRGRPNSFYAVYVDKETLEVKGVGRRLGAGDNYKNDDTPAGCLAFYPIGKNGTERVWRYERDSMLRHIEDGDIICTPNMTLNVIKRRAVKYNPVFSVWTDGRYNAGTHGTNLIREIFGGNNRFSYPKSLYTVRDCVKFSTQDKPDALIVDFFAGSGTTLHAVNLLNAEDGGRRRCVLVTNNEGDIARSVTWPRTVCSVEGHDINGTPLKGNYLGTEREMSAGFKANAAFFALNCLDKNLVELGDQFNQTLPVLWLKAGGCGRCPTFEAKTLPPYKIFEENKFAVLFDESHFADFANDVDAAQVETLFAVTGSDASLNDMAKQLRVKRSFRLYEDYLENFKLEEAEP